MRCGYATVKEQSMLLVALIVLMVVNIILDIKCIISNKQTTKEIYKVVSELLKLP